MSAMTSILFLGGWLPILGWEPFADHSFWQGVWHFFWFAAKISFVAFCFLWVRATFPRYRYDQLMRLGWKVFLPLSLAMVVFYSAALVLTGWLPGGTASASSASIAPASTGVSP
jgi:NADH-quinone oxidoreductase subunit H